MSTRDSRGRFAPKARALRSPAYRKRIEPALRKGKSLKEARGHAVRPLKMWETAKVYGTEKYEKSLSVLERMRHGDSRSKAARAEGITPEQVMRHVGSAIERDARGRYRAKAIDHLYRSMMLLDERGGDYVDPASSREASKLAKYNNALQRYRDTGDDRALRKFRSMKLRTRQKQSLLFLTDLDVIDRLERAGMLHFEVYRLVA